MSDPMASDWSTASLTYFKSAVTESVDAKSVVAKSVITKSQGKEGLPG